jgi:hypothetical protein
MSVIAGIHPVIVLITVQGLLRITSRAGKLNFKFKDQSDSCFCPEQLFALFEEFLKNYFNKNFARFREDGSILIFDPQTQPQIQRSAVRLVIFSLQRVFLPAAAEGLIKADEI